MLLSVCNKGREEVRKREIGRHREGERQGARKRAMKRKRESEKTMLAPSSAKSLPVNWCTLGAFKLQAWIAAIWQPLVSLFQAGFFGTSKYDPRV